MMDVKEKVTCFSLCMSTTPYLAIVLISAVLNVSQHVLLGLQFSELSWDHSYPEEEGDSHILWLEFDGEEDGTAVNKLLKIYSKQVRKKPSAGRYFVVAALPQSCGGSINCRQSRCACSSVLLLLKISGELIAAVVFEEVYEWCYLSFVL